MQTNIAATMILGEEHWEIRLPIGTFPSEEAGQEALDSAVAQLEMVDNCPGILLKVHDQARFLTDRDVQILELNDDAKARLGAPIDVSTNEGKKRALESLKTMDPAYVMTPDDFSPSGKTLHDFIKRYGEGRRLDHIGDQLLPQC